MGLERSHKTELSTDLIVYNIDGSVKETRHLNTELQRPDTVALKVRDAEGNIVREKTIPVRSFVQNYSEVLFHAMGSAAMVGTCEYTDTSGVTKQDNTHQNIVNAADNDDDYGIWVGTDDAAVAISDYTLGTKVAHGTGAAQLDYGENQFIAATMDGTDIVYKTWRTFFNDSGGTITIKEVGLVAIGGTGGAFPHLILRDIEDEDSQAINVAVADQETLTITYTFTSTQASGFLKQWLQLLESTNRGTTANVSIKYVGGSGASVGFKATTYNTYLDLSADASDDEFGVVIGSDGSALDSEDYELGTLIADGSGPGQLDYSAVDYEDLATSGADVTFVFKRPFTNHSGATVTIEEVGLYTAGDGTKRFMIVRTLTGTLALADEESVTVKYTFKHTV